MKVEAKKPDPNKNYFMEFQLSQDQAPFLRQRGDFCLHDSDRCQENTMKHIGEYILPSSTKTGRYNLRVIIYNDENIPISCKSAEINYE